MEFKNTLLTLIRMMVGDGAKFGGPIVLKIRETLLIIIKG